MPPHTHYVEPYPGGLSVLLAKRPSRISEVANDLDGRLSNSGPSASAEDSFIGLGGHQAVRFLKTNGETLNKTIPPTSEKAVRFFIYCRQSQPDA